MNIYVHKFGGASLATPALIANSVEIINRLERPCIIIVSAIGKTTNALEQVVKSKFFNNDNPRNHLSKIISYHSDIINELFSRINPDKITSIKSSLLPYWQYIEQIIQQPLTYSYGQLYDQIVSIGEIISSIIVSEYLNSTGVNTKWIDIRNILITDNQWRSANVLINESEKNFSEQILPNIQQQSILLTQGFIGSTSSGFTTTLGREGSDYTAALIANFSNAKCLTIWKDVEGILNADPRYFKNPQKIDELSYYDAIEMTYYGATVIHPKTIKPLQNKNIPLYVKSFIHPDSDGTIIHQPKEKKKITTYSYLPNQILISLQSTDYAFFTENNIQLFFQIINEFNIKVNLMQITALNFSVCLTNDEIIIPALIRQLQKHFKVLFNQNVAVLTIRHYIPNSLNTILQDKKILLEQRTRHHVQFVIQE